MRSLRKGLAIVIALSMVFSMFVFNFATSAAVTSMSFTAVAVDGADPEAWELDDVIELTLNITATGVSVMDLEFGVPAGLRLTAISDSDWSGSAIPYGPDVPFAQVNYIFFTGWGVPGPVTFTFEVTDVALAEDAEFDWIRADAFLESADLLDPPTDLIDGGNGVAQPSGPIVQAPAGDHFFFFIRPYAGEDEQRVGHPFFGVDPDEAQIRAGGTRALTPGGMYEALIFMMDLDGTLVRIAVGAFDITDEDVDGEPLIEVVSFEQGVDFIASDFYAFEVNVHGPGDPLRYQAAPAARAGHIDYINEAGRFFVALELPYSLAGQPNIPGQPIATGFHAATLTFRVHEDARDLANIPLFTSVHELVGESDHWDAISVGAVHEGEEGQENKMVTSWLVESEEYTHVYVPGVWEETRYRLVYSFVNRDSVHYVDIDDVWEIEIDQDEVPEWRLNDRTGETTFELVADVNRPVIAGEIVTWSADRAGIEFENVPSEIGDEYVTVEVTVTDPDFYGWVEITVTRGRYDGDDEYAYTEYTAWIEIAFVEIYNEDGTEVLTDNEDDPTLLSVGEEFEFSAVVYRAEYDLEDPANPKNTEYDWTDVRISVWNAGLEEWEWVVADPSYYDLTDGVFTPFVAGRFRLTATSDDIAARPGLYAHTYVFVTGRLNLEGRFTLAGKFEFNVYDWQWNHGDTMRDIVNAGILVELIDMETNTRIHPDAYTRTDGLGNWSLTNVLIDADLIDVFAEPNRIRLRASRRGEYDRDGAGNFVRTEGYLNAEIGLNTVGGGVAFDSTIFIVPHVRLHPGAFMPDDLLPGGVRNNVTSFDVSLIRALVGSEATGLSQAFDVNEIWGIDIHDFNSVVTAQQVNILRATLPLSVLPTVPTP